MNEKNMNPRRRKWQRAGLWLVGLTMAYNVAEGIVAVWAGIRAGSVALIGFGFDSYIECAAAAALFWRLAVEARGASPEKVAKNENRVHRFVGVTFLLLAVYVVVQAVVTLVQAQAVSESAVGIALAVLSLILMPLIAWGKMHAAAIVESGALKAEAKETLACSYLSFTLLLGLTANAAGGWWWADPIAALFMVPWLIKEGLEGLEKAD